MGNNCSANTSFESPDSESINKSSFDYISVIGRGGFGKVWKVESKKNNKLYAMKEMSKVKIIDKREVVRCSLNIKTKRKIPKKKCVELKNPLTLDNLFHYLCINDANYPLIKLMKPNFEEIENRNNLGQNLLHVAVQNKSIKIANYLIDNNANINSKDNRNNTSLHIAVKNEDYNMVKLLMKYNPKLNILNNNKETPLDIARKKGNKLLINYLENNSKKKKVYVN